MEISVITNRLKNLPTRHKPGIFFMHIPKTGGTSVISSLKKNYPFNFFKVNAISSLNAARKIYGDQFNSFTQCYQLRECVAAYAMELGIKCIAGHVPYSENLFASANKNYLIITLLRDPVQRFISKYLYNFYKSGDHCKFDMKFFEYLDSEAAKISGREYLRYLSDAYEPEEIPARHLIEKSKENLLKLDVVGFLEDMDAFTIRFQEKTNIKLRIPHKNRTRDLTKEQIIEPAAIDRIKDICKYDIEIYQYARQHFQ